MLFSYRSLLLATVLSTGLASPLIKDGGSSGVEGSTPFQGTGSIRMYHDADGAYMGCSTSTGLWTVDESQCATFTGSYDGSYYHVKSEAGTCGTTNLPNQYGVFWNCGKGFSTSYSTIDIGYGHRIFSGDLYLTYAHGQAVYPTGTQAITLHLWGGDDSGKFVQLGWNATDPNP
ncbi:MAG: hypothetical protein M1820_001463 [Bogoriella megaspora]|nr:MAG: hypothetical protein M1820_001463 [Bogoriella megaspora]